MNILKKHKISTILNQIQNSLAALSIKKETLEKEFTKDYYLVSILDKFLKYKQEENIKEEHVNWFLMPLKLLDDDYIDGVCSLADEIRMYNQGEEIDSIKEFGIASLILNKMKIYGQYQDNYQNSPALIDDFLTHDYFEKIMLKTGRIDLTAKMLKQVNIMDYEESLNYIAEEMRYTDFYNSLDKQIDTDLLYNILFMNPGMLKTIVNYNTRNNLYKRPTLNIDTLRIITSTLKQEKFSSSLSQKHLGQLLDFVLQDEKLREDKVKLFPILVTVLAESTQDKIDVFLHSLTVADGYIPYFAEQVVDKEMEITRFFADEIENPTIFLHNNCMNENDSKKVNKERCSILLTEQFHNLTYRQKNDLENYLLHNANHVTAKGIMKMFQKNKVDFSKIKNIDTFNLLLDFLYSESKEEFRMKKKSIQAVKDQLDANYLSRYLWYMSNTSLKTEKEYVAHSAYFKNHSIDEFFTKFYLYDEANITKEEKAEKYWKRSLENVTDDKSKKKQQLRFAHKVSPNLPPELMKEAVDVLEFSDSIEDIKAIVDLTINPLFFHLTAEKKKMKLQPFIENFQNNAVIGTLDGFDIIIPNKGDISLPKSGFVKCKRRGEGNPVYVYIGKKV